MNQLEAELKDAVAEFEAVQTEQRIAFESGRPGDFAAWRERRERVFGSLQYFLNQFNLKRQDQMQDQVISEVKARILALIEGEKNLEFAAAVRFHAVRERLSSMRKGKRALAGYELGQGGAKAARFLSSRT